ncbi:MAG TPA: RodZ domain-containing protein [Chloroflexota bacterium]
MPTLGEVFRDGRFRRGFSLEQVETDTKIRKKYLVALEEEDYSALPAPIYARGFLHSYAEYLGIDPNFADKLFLPPERTVKVPEVRPAASGFRETRTISLGAVLTFITALVVIAGVVFLYAQYLSYAANTPTEAAPRATAQATATAPAVIAPVPTPLPTVTPLPSPTPVLGVEVAVRVTERSWLRVVADGQNLPLFEGELQAGENRTWKANDKMDMRVGNAGGVEVTVNGMRQGKLGASGEVKNVTWGRQ